jgi:hypothetical protein
MDALTKWRPGTDIGDSVMADKAWKAFERRLCRDVGTERIPVTGGRHGADGAN